MKKIITFLFLGSIFFLSALNCSEDEQSDCTKGSNKLVTENRGKVNVSSILSNSPAEIIITDTTNLYVKAEDNLLPKLSTEVSNGLLTVNLQGGCIQNNYPFTVITPAEGLSSVRINGQGDVTCQKEISGSSFSTEINGAGNIDYSGGTVDLHEIRITGAGSVDAGNIVSGVSKINISGSGDCYVNAERELYVTITGSGSVFYKGSPQLSVNITGTGKITKF